MIKQRLQSLDALRGADLILLTVVGPLLTGWPVDGEWYQSFTLPLHHVSWQGFRLWDLIMPLFMFCSGVTIPFALERYRTGQAPMGQFWGRVAKRVALLWLLGMLVQGNLLSLDWASLKPFSNTLQAIAVGYLFSAITFVYLPRKAALPLAVVLLVVYQWILGTSPAPLDNIAYNVDKAVLGGAMDGARGALFSPHYFYAWILPSLGFVATVLSGMIAGAYVKGVVQARKAALLALWGAGCVAVGWAMDTVGLEVIKPIWSPAMVLVSTGYCLLLVALFYWWIDVRGNQKGIKWLLVFGTNSIAAYLLSETPFLRGLCRQLVGGLQQYVGDWYGVCLHAACVGALVWVVWAMYKRGIFLKV